MLGVISTLGILPKKTCGFPELTIYKGNSPEK